MGDYRIPYREGKRRRHRHAGRHGRSSWPCGGAFSEVKQEDELTHHRTICAPLQHILN